MPHTAIWITPKGKTQEITLTSVEAGALSQGGVKQSGYVCFVDLYASHDEAKEVAETHLKGTTHFLRDDAFIRNEIQVHRIYLTSQEARVQIASKYFDAWTHCQCCRSFNTVIYQHDTTMVFCVSCKVHRRYRPHAPGGMNATRPDEPQKYDLKLCPRQILYEDTYG